MVSRSQILKFVEKHGLIRPIDVQSKGVNRQQLIRMCHYGELERIGRGLYAIPGKCSNEFIGLAEVAKLAPNGVVCLISALQFHGLTTQISPFVWLMLEGSVNKPVFIYPPINVMHASGDAFKFGIEIHHINKVPVKIYTPAKTVADCFKYRNKIGLDIAVEALKEVIKNRKAGIDEIWKAAKVCRVSNVIRPYLEACA